MSEARYDGQPKGKNQRAVLRWVSERDSGNGVIYTIKDVCERLELHRSAFHMAVKALARDRWVRWEKSRPFGHGPRPRIRILRRLQTEVWE